jgi:hypothetical protein
VTVDLAGPAAGETDKRRPLALLLVAAVCLHNLEEWLAFGAYGEPFHQLFARWNIPLTLPPLRVMEIGLIGATLVPVTLIVVALRGQRRWWKDALLVGVAGVFLLNVFVPHVVAALAIGGYAPGLVTALLLNLPICSLMLRRVSQDGTLSSSRFRLALMAGMAALPVATGALLLVTASRTGGGS